MDKLQQALVQELRETAEKYRAALEKISAMDPADFDEPANEWGYAAVAQAAQKTANEALGYKP